MVVQPKLCESRSSSGFKNKTPLPQAAGFFFARCQYRHAPRDWPGAKQSTDRSERAEGRTDCWESLCRAWLGTTRLQGHRREVVSHPPGCALGVDGLLGKPLPSMARHYTASGASPRSRLASTWMRTRGGRIAGKAFAEHGSALPRPPFRAAKGKAWEGRCISRAEPRSAGALAATPVQSLARHHAESAGKKKALPSGAPPVTTIGWITLRLRCRGPSSLRRDWP